MHSLFFSRFFSFLLFNAFLIEPTPSHDDKWNQLYTKAEEDASKERTQNQNVKPLKKPSTIEILQNNLDKLQRTIEW